VGLIGNQPQGSEISCFLREALDSRTLSELRLRCVFASLWTVSSRLAERRIDFLMLISKLLA
jgi:hypothetical protein